MYTLHSILVIGSTVGSLCGSHGQWWPGEGGGGGIERERETDTGSEEPQSTTETAVSDQDEGQCPTHQEDTREVYTYTL